MNYPNMKKFEADFFGRTVSIETGRMAKQADGAVVLQLGGSVVLATVVAEKHSRDSRGFLPLTCDYIERPSAAGRIPGGFFRREGRQGELEVLASRLIDRPIRPLLPKGWTYETQVIAHVMSADGDNETDVLAITATSAALHISDVPFGGPTAGVRVGRIGGQFVANPTRAQQNESDMNIVVVWKEDALVMVEGGAKEVSEDEMVEALMFGRKAAEPLLAIQHQLREAAGKPKREFAPPVRDEELYAKVREFAAAKLQEAQAVKAKLERYGAVDAVTDQTVEHFSKADDPAAPSENTVRNLAHELEGELLRSMVVNQGRRIDGRSFTEVRPITCDVSVMPRTHGSALFTRGETQALVTATLGTQGDAQKIEALTGDRVRRFLLHYNFPPFSVGEVKMLRSPGRREIGHGTLARRAIQAVLPDEKLFPYTIRVVSDILESNGSSSMATVCGGTLALMDLGVPITAPVAGVAMGLIKEGDKVCVLTDILGDEDHLGDMDFKVCGTKNGITAIQMDIKIDGISEDLLHKAMAQAKEGRLHILKKMAETIAEPRKQLSTYAPRITVIFIPPSRIKDIIGPGGKHVKGIQEETGCKIDINDTGQIQIASPDGESARAAILKIRGLTQEPEEGKFYMGRVTDIKDFGAFVEILPGVEGLLHISQIDNQRVQAVEDVLKSGDEIIVKVLEIDRNGKIRLSRKEALGKNVELANPTDADLEG
jgi:polyribonucleotide nucleotidyltransferase